MASTARKSPVPDTNKLRDQIVRAFGRRYEGTACVPDLANEVALESTSAEENLRILSEVVDGMVRDGILRAVKDPSDHRTYDGLQTVYELAR